MEVDYVVLLSRGRYRYLDLARSREELSGYVYLLWCGGGMIEGIVVYCDAWMISGEEDHQFRASKRVT